MQHRLESRGQVRADVVPMARELRFLEQELRLAPGARAHLLHAASIRRQRDRCRAFRWEWRSALVGTSSDMDIAAVVVLVVIVLLPVVLVGCLFVWGALKDGQEDRALQARLGIRRRTRLGR